MSALYRKYRPIQFKDVIGQDHISQNIKNSLLKGTVSHAYLLNGPRGTGKTTTARLLAKAVNCLDLTKEGEPCGKCQICQDVADNRLVDIIEIDAASNRGIDEIRELRERVAYAPTAAKYKVYIIDEVHMLTKEAFNALLKTLEEPPSYVIFILATTELSKVPETIISRSQRFTFHLASHEALTELLKKIVKEEGFKLDDSAIALVAERAEGSFRDALTLLGNISNQEPGKVMNEADLRTLLGLPQSATVSQARQLLETGDGAGLIALLRQVLNEGNDLLILVKAISDLLKKDILTGSLKQEGLLATAQILEQILVLLARTKNAADPVALILAELYSLAESRAGHVASPPTPVITEKAVTTKKEITEDVPVPIKEPRPEAVKEVPLVITDTVAVQEKSIETVSDSSSSESTPVDSVSAPVATKDGQEFWQGLLSAIKEDNHGLYIVLRSAALESLFDDKFIMAVKFRFYSERLYEPKNKKIIEVAASKVAGKNMSMECQVRADIALPQEAKAEEDLLGAVVDVFEIEEGN